jgi:hypothetical protein
MTGPLERRYRRLLALYPSRHRSAYLDEMLAALLAGAGPDQRFPRVAEVVDLVRGAFAAHAASRPARPSWSAAAGVVGTVGAIGLSASVLRFAGLSHTVFEPSAPAPAWSLAFFIGLLAVWPIAALAAVVGWRGLAAVAATLGLLGETALGLWLFGVGHVPITVVAALLTAGTLAFWAAASGPVVRGVPLWAPIAAGSIGVVTGWLGRAPFTGTVPWLPVGSNWPYEAGALGIVVVMATTVLLASGVLALPGAVRARVLVLALPVIGVVLLRNAGIHYPPTFVVACLLATPFVGVGIMRLVDRQVVS